MNGRFRFWVVAMCLSVCVHFGAALPARAAEATVPPAQSEVGDALTERPSEDPSQNDFEKKSLEGKVKLAGEAEGDRFAIAQASGGGNGGSAGGEGEYEDKSGTDPRDFAPKFMPYYRYTKLDNDLEVHELTLFGLQDFMDGKFAITYELPTFKDVNWDAADNPTPFNIGETGTGDLILRVFAPLGKEKKFGMSWMWGAQLTLPTHTSDVLGNDRVTGGPLLVNIWDLDFLPMPGAFLAMMHITEFTLIDDDEADDAIKYIGRYFMMVPLIQKYKIYTLPEVQFIYDFDADNASLWIGPEFGKMWKWGTTYIKPGFGVANSLGTDRDFTFETGIRYFFGWNNKG